MLFLSFSSDETSFLRNNFNPTSTAPFYPLQLLNYDRDAATDPSLPGWKTVDQHFARSNNLYAFSEYTLLF